MSGHRARVIYFAKTHVPAPATIARHHGDPTRGAVLVVRLAPLAATAARRVEAEGNALLVLLLAVRPLYDHAAVARHAGARGAGARRGRFSASWGEARTWCVCVLNYPSDYMFICLC